MDKSTIEKCLKIYPEIDDEIKRHETEISNLKSKRLICVSKLNSGDEAEIKYANDMIPTIDAALELYRNELSILRDGNIKIQKILPALNHKEKKVLELRFWNGQYSPTKWNDVAGKLNYHVKSVEKIYGKIVKAILIS